MKLSALHQQLSFARERKQTPYPLRRRTQLQRRFLRFFAFRTKCFLAFLISLANIARSPSSMQTHGRSLLAPTSCYPSRQRVVANDQATHWTRMAINIIIIIHLQVHTTTLPPARSGSRAWLPLHTAIRTRGCICFHVCNDATYDATTHQRTQQRQRMQQRQRRR